jgi:hypothetical protein
VSNANGTISEDVIQQSVDVVIHEVAHVLGLNSAALKFIWDPATNQPRTARPFTETTVECVDGITRNYYGLPDENTVKLSTDPISGQRSAFVVTPKVRTVARNQFNCQDLVGAQLENQPTNPADCFGSHWDERLFYSETLSGIISPTTVILSPLSEYEICSDHLSPRLSFCLTNLVFVACSFILLQLWHFLKTQVGTLPTIITVRYRLLVTGLVVISFVSHVLFKIIKGRQVCQIMEEVSSAARLLSWDAHLPTTIKLRVQFLTTVLLILVHPHSPSSISAIQIMEVTRRQIIVLCMHYDLIQDK